MTPAAPTLTLQDIADIARVRRPVVSMWRSRPQAAGREVLFPTPVAVRGQVEHFDRDEVVAWIERTNRGNNDDFALDARAGAPPLDATLDDATALLCLAVAAESELAGLDADDLLDLADECDPDDTYLYSEVGRLAEGAAALTAYVDDVRASAYGPGDALARLESSRLGRGRREADFDPAAIKAIAAVVHAIGTQDGERTVMADASHGDTALALEVATRWPEGRLGGLVIAGDSEKARLNRRIAMLRGVGPSVDEAAVSLLTVMDLPGTDPIEAIDELQLSLPEGRSAVVIGPAALLCDVPDDPGVETARDAIVRTGTLRFAARLPRGLWLRAPRKALGMWVFGSQSARKIEDRAVALADLSDEMPDALPVDDLATDAVASLGNLRGRAFRFARLVPTSRLIAAREVVPAGAHAVRHVAPEPAERIVRIEALLDGLARDLPVRQPVVRPTGRSTQAADVSIGELLARKAIRLVRGGRLDLSLTTPDGAVRVVDPTRGDSGIGFDPVDLEANHPRATRTEPGDIVFTHTPRPAAYVDDHGGSVVASPARILRVRDDAPLGPRALANAINALPDHAREWRAWRLPVIDPAQRNALEAELAALHELRLELAARVRQADTLATELIDAAAARAIDLTEGDTSATT